MQAYKTSQGNWQVNFSAQGKQQTLYLGRGFNAVSADRVARIVTDILTHRKRGDTVPIETVRKVEALPERIRNSFERLGLIQGVAVLTMDKLLELFYESKSLFKQSTQMGYKDVGKYLTTFFGSDCRIGSVDKSDCERFRTHLLSRYSPSTVSRGIRRCRCIFKFAVENDWLQKNPFQGISSGIEVNLKRQVYVSREIVSSIMPYCRDDYDRLLLALGRFCGLRIPSEAKELRFSGFSGDVVRTHHSCKTGAREVPLFKEVREIFLRIVSDLGDRFRPDDLVFAGIGGFRHRLVKAVRASGVECWPKLFVNLRSSSITDLSERGYSEKTLDAIFGNSSLVRSRHYVQFRRERELRKCWRTMQTLGRWIVWVWLGACCWR